VTTHANELMLQLPHPRFPTVIEPEFRDIWLTEPNIPMDLIKPLDSDKLVTWLCDPAVGKTSGKDVRHDAALLHAPSLPETLNLFA
jgi:putative SOS response-associated peptidase YedK